MSNDKLANPTITYWLVDYGAIANPLVPLATEISNTTFSYNISTALDNSTAHANAAASDTNKELLITDNSQSEVPTFYNYGFTPNGRLDAVNTTAGSVYNLYVNKVKAAGARYWVVKRIGYLSTVAATAGQEVSLYDMTTDNPQLQITDKAMLKVKASFLANGQLVSKVALS